MEPMAVTLSIKNVPDEVADALRERARSNQRSLQGELLTIVEQAASKPKTLTFREIYDRGKAQRLSSKRGESVRIVRRMRDERTKQVMSLLGKARGRR